MMLTVAGPARPVAAGQGTGNPRLTVSNAALPGDRVSTITVTGTDYLVPPYAEGESVFGGIYLFFGWVANPSRFGPSIRNNTGNDGTFGTTYHYPGDGGDPSTRGNAGGTMHLVAFTPGGESGEAASYIMDRDGNWTASLRIHGSTYTTIHPVTGVQTTVDCQVVQCGVFTIGAHGKASATNEVFTPINFTSGAPTTAPPTTAAPTTAAPTTAVPGASVPTTPSSVPPGDESTTVPDNTTEPETTQANPDQVSDPSVSTAPAGEQVNPGPGDDRGDEALAVSVTEVRSTGGGLAPVAVGGGAIAAVVGAGVVLRRRGAKEPVTGLQIDPTAEPRP